MRDRYTIYRQRLARSRGFASVVVGLLVGLLMLTGCTAPAGPADPTNTGTGHATATESVRQLPPPTTVAPAYKPATDQGPAVNVPVPVMPDKAKEFSKEGLVAFSEYWYSTLGYVYETGDSGPMMEVSVVGCKTCAYVNEPIGQLYREGGWIVGGTMTVYESSSEFKANAQGAYQATLMIQQAKVTAFSAEKTITNDYPQRRARANIVVAAYTEGQWQALTAEPLKDN